MKLRYRILSGVLIVLTACLVSLAVAVSYNSRCPTSASVQDAGERMTAIVYRCYGPPEVLEIEQINKPKPAADQVLVKVHVAAVNPLDWHVMRGEPYLMRMSAGIGAPNDILFGEDFAGTVEAVGESVTRFKPGDAVFGSRGGSIAEYLAVRETGAIVHKPANVTFAEASGVGIAAVTALQGLRDIGQLQPGQHVLINGASGGVGTYAVQIAKALGARVTGVCSTRNVQLVKSLGADRVIDYTKENFTDDSEQYDMILDNVSTQSLSAMRRVLKPNGRIVIVGGVTRDPWLGPLVGPIKAMLYSPFVDEKMGMFIASMTAPALQTIADLMHEGKVKTVIDREYAFEETSAAVAYLETGRARGKILVRVSADPTAPEPAATTTQAGQ